MKRGVILGLGISGLATAKFLSQQGISVIGLDKAPPKEASFFDWVEDTLPFSFEKGDYLVKSPGISFSHPVVLEALKQGIHVGSEIELALETLQGNGPTLFGITGSNGKTTTTLLTTHILQKVGKKALAAGNVGRPLISCIDEDASIIVVEMSSFQLEGLCTPAFDAAVILNITPNHLDRYPDFASYVEAKWQLASCLKRGGTLFVPKQIPKPKAHHFAVTPIPSHESVASIFSPCYRNRWDKENCVAAWALCRELGLNETEFLQGCSGFVKPPHRLEYIGQREGVHYINDSKATSVDAVKMALSSIQSDIFLIAGGVDKGGSFADLLPYCAKKVKGIFAIGEAADRIKEELGEALSVEVHPSLKRAFSRAQSLAKRDQTIILSPGCSSYDQFRHFSDRGDTFKKYFQENNP